MKSRKIFLRRTIALLTAISIFPLLKVLAKLQFKYKRKGKSLGKVLVLWFSQTGHTRRIGRLIAYVFKQQGLDVTAGEIREFKKQEIVNYDFIVVGTPVFYYDTPIYVKEWMAGIPNLDGIPVASFVTYGGPEGDQHNAASNILNLLSKKGGIPVGIETFINMGVFPLSWSSPGVQEHKQLPDENTFKKARKYAISLIDRLNSEVIYEIDKKISLRRLATIFDLRYWTKLSIDQHTIDKNKCTACGICVKKCPVDAINIDAYTVNIKTCVLCFGCINNCPEQAIVMMKGDKRLYGFNEFLKRNGIVIKEPKELQ